jgi:hypothetical protein
MRIAKRKRPFTQAIFTRDKIGEHNFIEKHRPTRCATHLLLAQALQNLSDRFGCAALVD